MEKLPHNHTELDQKHHSEWGPQPGTRLGVLTWRRGGRLRVRNPLTACLRGHPASGAPQLPGEIPGQEGPFLGCPEWPGVRVGRWRWPSWGWGGRPHRPWWTHTRGRSSSLRAGGAAGRRGGEEPPHARQLARPRGQLSPPWGGDAILFSLRREAPTSRAGGGGSTWDAPPESPTPGPTDVRPAGSLRGRGATLPGSLGKVTLGAGAPGPDGAHSPAAASSPDLSTGPCGSLGPWVRLRGHPTRTKPGFHKGWGRARELVQGRAQEETCSAARLREAAGEAAVV